MIVQFGFSGKVRYHTAVVENSETARGIVRNRIATARIIAKKSTAGCPSIRANEMWATRHDFSLFSVVCFL
jgi:hypothetical protein